MTKILRSAALALLLAAGAGTGLPAGAAPIRPVALAVVNVQVVALGYRASQLIGRDVTNDSGEKVGKIDDLVVSRDKVLFAIIGVGGFLGIPDRLVVAPYDHLVVTAQKIVMPGATKAALNKLPPFHYAP
jgi:sporulation protein YlmC with PRC-barrel domain